MICTCETVINNLWKHIFEFLNLTYDLQKL